MNLDDFRMPNSSVQSLLQTFSFFDSSHLEIYFRSPSTGTSSVTSSSVTLSCHTFSGLTCLSLCCPGCRLLFCSNWLRIEWFHIYLSHRHMFGCCSNFDGFAPDFQQGNLCWFCCGFFFFLFFVDIFVNEPLGNRNVGASIVLTYWWTGYHV